MAAPLHRHQSSLEGVLNFSPPPPPLGTEQRNQARQRFRDICQHFDRGIPVDNYSHPRLVRYTYEYTRSEASGDYFLRLFFKTLDLAIDGCDPIISASKMCVPSSSALPSIFLTTSSCLVKSWLQLQ
ncbi:hypothetical protein F4802DRAFT_514472 [Xylaria palmicola]|nr:hypothetical protein F4802DRAFT_514472 [Xylaria palmicola]